MHKKFIQILLQQFILQINTTLQYAGEFYEDSYPPYLVQINFKMKINHDTHSVLHFSNNKSLDAPATDAITYDKISIDYEGKMANKYTVLNIFNTTSKDELACYKKFNSQNLTICPSVLNSTFDNFIKTEVQMKFLDITQNILGNDMYVIFENSKTKKDIGFYDKATVDWVNRQNFKIKKFDDLSFQKMFIHCFFVVITCIQTFLFFNTFIRRSIKKKELVAKKQEIEDLKKEKLSSVFSDRTRNSSEPSINQSSVSNLSNSDFYNNAVDSDVLNFEKPLDIRIEEIKQIPSGLPVLSNPLKDITTQKQKHKNFPTKPI